MLALLLLISRPDFASDAQVTHLARCGDPLSAATAARFETISTGETPIEEHRQADLRLARSAVPLPARYSRHFQAGDAGALAPRWFSPVLALEVMAVTRLPHGANRYP